MNHHPVSVRKTYNGARRVSNGPDITETVSKLSLSSLESSHNNRKRVKGRGIVQPIIPKLVVGNSPEN